MAFENKLSKLLNRAVTVFKILEVEIAFEEKNKRNLQNYKDKSYLQLYSMIVVVLM